MPRAKVSVAARLEHLRGVALDKARALPAAETITFDPMMRLLGVSRPVLRDWCRTLPDFEDSGCFSGGGRGVEYAFVPIATVWFLIRHFEMHQAEVVRTNLEKRLSLAGTNLTGVPAEFDLRESRDAVQLHVRIREAQIADGKLIDGEATVSAVREMVSDMQAACLMAATEMDPTGSWEPEFREKFDDAMSTVTVKFGDAGRKCVNQLHAARSDTAETDKRNRAA